METKRELLKELGYSDELINTIENFKLEENIFSTKIVEDNFNEIKLNETVDYNNQSTSVFQSNNHSNFRVKSDT